MNNKNYQYYNNRNTYGNICIPKREEILNYLIKEKFLSEFKTNEEKQQVLYNLGILQIVDDLLNLIDQKVDNSQLSNYITLSYFLNKIEELRPKDEKSKGYYSSYEELVQNIQDASEGDWAIVNVEGIWYIYKYKENLGWQQSETYENNIDLSDYVKLTELELYQKLLISGENIKTINGESILGSGNIEIKVDKETVEQEVHNIVYPLRISASISASTLEYTGQSQIVTITAQARKSSNVSATYEISYGNITEQFNGKYTAQVSDLGTHNFTIKATFEGESVSTKVSVKLIHPTYMGFDITNDWNEVNLSKLSKKLRSSISATETINNPIAGSYLWIISPYTVNQVATDPTYFYKVTMFYAGSKNGLQYYRSNSAIDVSNLTYYIK